MKKSIILFSMATMGALALAGCTFSAYANLTVAPGSLETAVAEELRAQIGGEVTPNLDCGEDHIDLVEDTTVTCALSVDGYDEVYDAEVTITEVDGTDYSFFVQVADEPRA